MNKQAVIIIFSCLYMLGIITFISNFQILFTFVVLFGLIFFYLKRKILSLKYFLIFLCIFFLGILNSASNLKYDDELTSFSDKDVEVNAKVISIPTNNIKDRTKFYAKVYSVKSEHLNMEDLNV